MPIARRVFLQINYSEPLGLEMLRGIADFIAETGHWTCIANTQLPAIRTVEDLSRMNPQFADGCVAQVYGAESLGLVRRYTAQVVNVSNRVEHVPVPRVSPDDPAVGRMGADHFLQRGYRSMGFVGFSGHWYSDRRRDAFIARALDAEVSPHVYNDLQDEQAPVMVYHARLEAWLASLPRPVAIMGSNDTRARHVLLAAGAMGLRVPDEVAVLGVDADEWIRMRSHVPLSSLDPAARKVGYEAAGMLDALMAGKPPPTEPMFVPPVGVITRRSTDAIAVDDSIVVQASQYIREHTDRMLTVEEVVEAVGCSRRSLEMRFRKHLGRSPQEAIWRAHVDRARHLLEHTNLPAKAIAQRCGFGNAERLSVVFRRYTGLSPTEYRKQRVR